MPIPSEPLNYNKTEGNEVIKSSVDPTKIKRASPNIKPTVSNPTTSNKSTKKAASKRKTDSMDMVYAFKCCIRRHKA